MRIGFISGHACIRAQKMALGLIKQGHEVYFISSTTPSFLTYYKAYAKYESIEQLRESIEIFDPHIDLWHVHNEPSYYVSLCKEVSEKPVVLDVHDSNVARLSQEKYDELIEAKQNALRISSEERLNFQLADALVFPSGSFGKIVLDEFALEQPSIVLPSYVPSSYYHYGATEWVGGVVYEGRIDLPEEYNKPGLQGFEYTDYTKFAQKCKEIGVDFHIYATRNDKKYTETYADALLHPGQKYKK